MPLYDYRCVRGHVTESIQSVTQSVIPCAVCQSPANRMSVYVFGITKPEVDTRGMFRRFQDASAEIDRAATKVEQSTGQAVKTPNFWKQAQARAQAMTAAGESPAVRKEQLG